MFSLFLTLSLGLVRKTRRVRPYEKNYISQNEQKCFTLTNNFRAQNGKPNLVYSAEIEKLAYEHAQNMATGKVPFGHDGFQERANILFSQLPMSSIAENVAYNYNTADPVTAMVNQWINSAGHKANMLGNYNRIGIGFVSSGSKWYGCQIFALVR